MSEIQNGQIIAPPKIPRYILEMAKPEAPLAENNPVNLADLAQAGTNVNPSIFPNHAQPVVVHQPGGTVHLTSVIAEGMILQKTIPVYPAIAKASRREGTVVLQAVISTGGAIQNLRVLSGDPMLTQAALDAVKNWRYRPYLLNGKPIEVETTINVVFKLTQ
jgi:protein TonB